MQRRPAGTPFCFWFGSSDPHRPYEAGTGVTSSDAARQGPGARVPPGYARGAQRPARLLLRSPALRSRSRRDPRRARARRRARQHDRHRDVRQRHAVPAREGEGLRRRRARAAGDPLAGRGAGPARPSTHFVVLTDIAPTLLEGAGVAAVSTMTGRTLVPLLRGRRASRDAISVFLERERHANVRRGDLSYPVTSDPDKRLPLYQEFSARTAGRPAIRSCILRSGRSATSTADRRSRCSSSAAPIHRSRSISSSRRRGGPAVELYDLRRDPHQLTNVAGRPEHRAAEERLRTALDRWMRDTADPRATTDDDRWDRFPYYGQPAK